MQVQSSYAQATHKTHGRFSKKEALQYVTARISPKLNDSHRQPMEREWVKNLAFLNGNQYFVDDGIGFRTPVLPPHKVVYRANIVRTLVTRAISTVLASSSVFRAPTRDHSKVERDKAFVTEKLFEHLRDNVVNWSELLEEALTWAAVCGSGFIEIGWNADAGSPDRFYLDENGETILGLTPDQQRIAEEEGRYEDLPPGEITAKVHSPLRVRWDWSSRTDFQADECTWAGTQEIVDMAALEDTYGAAAIKDVKPLEPRTTSLWWDEMLSFMHGGQSQSPGFLQPRDKSRSRTVLSRFFEKPMRKNNWKGRYIVIAGESVLVNRDNPMRATKYPIPFIKIDWQKRPGSFVGHPLMDDLRNPQFQYNNARAHQTEVVNVHSHPPIFVDKRSGLPTGMLAIEPGVAYPCDNLATGGKPVTLGPVPQIPKELADSANRALAEMQMISSQADPDMSKLPGQIRSRPGLDAMIEEKNKALTPAARSAMRATLTGGRMMLAFARAFYTTRRTMQYVGADNAYRVAEFEAADIRDDIRIVGEPDYFQNRSAERARILEYVQAGVLDPINNPEDKLSVLKTLAYGGAEDILAQRLIEEENQEREWDEMVGDPLKWMRQNDLGQPMLDYPTHDYDDDATHVRVMQQRMRSGEFRDLDPIARQLVIQHYQDHVEKLQRAMMQQMQMQQMAQPGGSANRGQPSRPKPKASQGAARG